MLFMEDIISEKEAAAEEIAAAKRKPTDRESETPEGIMAEEVLLANPSKVGISRAKALQIPTLERPAKSQANKNPGWRRVGCFAYFDSFLSSARDPAKIVLSLKDNCQALYNNRFLS